MLSWRYIRILYGRTLLALMMFLLLSILFRMLLLLSVLFRVMLLLFLFILLGSKWKCRFWFVILLLFVFLYSDWKFETWRLSFVVFFLCSIKILSAFSSLIEALSASGYSSFYSTLFSQEILLYFFFHYGTIPFLQRQKQLSKSDLKKIPSRGIQTGRRKCPSAL